MSGLVRPAPQQNISESPSKGSLSDVVFCNENNQEITAVKRNRTTMGVSGNDRINNRVLRKNLVIISASNKDDSNNQHFVDKVDVPGSFMINSLSASITDLHKIMVDFYDFIYDVHKTKFIDEQKKVIYGKFEVFNDDVNRWVSFVEKSGLFSEFYSTFKKVIKGVACKVFRNLPSLEINENLHEKIFTAQEIVREMISYLNSFCKFLKFLKKLARGQNRGNLKLVAMNLY